jgi:hypothetical protein
MLKNFHLIPAEALLHSAAMILLASVMGVLSAIFFLISELKMA